MTKLPSELLTLVTSSAAWFLTKSKKRSLWELYIWDGRRSTRPFTVGVTFRQSTTSILLDLALVLSTPSKSALGSPSSMPAVFVYCGVFCLALGEPSVEEGRSICLTQLTLRWCRVLAQVQPVPSSC